MFRPSVDNISSRFPLLSLFCLYDVLLDSVLVDEKNVNVVVLLEFSVYFHF